MWEVRGKPVDLSFHSQTRMVERGISEHLMIETLKEPETRWTQPFQGKDRQHAEKAFRNGKLHVVYEEDHVEIVVITAWWR